MASPKIGLAANRPARAAKGRRYIAYDTNQEWVGDGTDWIETSNGPLQVLLAAYDCDTDTLTVTFDPPLSEAPATLAMSGPDALVDGDPIDYGTTTWTANDPGATYSAESATIVGIAAEVFAADTSLSAVFESIEAIDDPVASLGEWTGSLEIEWPCA